MKWYDFVGSAGVFLIVLGYLLIQLNKLTNNDLIYSLLNAIGAALIIVSLLYDFNLSSFIIEAFWLILSLVGIVRYYLTNDRPKNVSS